MAKLEYSPFLLLQDSKNYIIYNLDTKEQTPIKEADTDSYITFLDGDNVVIRGKKRFILNMETKEKIDIFKQEDAVIETELPEPSTFQCKRQDDIEMFRYATVRDKNIEYITDDNGDAFKVNRVNGKISLEKIPGFIPPSHNDTTYSFGDKYIFVSTWKGANLKHRKEGWISEGDEDKVFVDKVIDVTNGKEYGVPTIPGRSIVNTCPIGGLIIINLGVIMLYHPEKKTKVYDVNLELDEDNILFILPNLGLTWETSEFYLFLKDNDNLWYYDSEKNMYYFMYYKRNKVTMTGYKRMEDIDEGDNVVEASMITDAYYVGGDKIVMHMDDSDEIILIDFKKSKFIAKIGEGESLNVNLITKNIAYINERLTDINTGKVINHKLPHKFNRALHFVPQKELDRVRKDTYKVMKLYVNMNISNTIAKFL